MGMIIMNGKEYTSSPKDGFPPIIYSDEEREVGVWRDGKPLYSIVISGTANANFDITTGVIPTIDNLVTSHIHIKSNGGTQINNYFMSSNDYARVRMDINPNTLHIDFGSSYPAKPLNYDLMLLYTKTTDVPGSGKYTTYGGLAHHYSESEHIIGTWVDGKPIYEKAIALNSLVLNNWDNVTHGILNIDTLCRCEATYYRDTGTQTVPMPFYESASYYAICLADKTYISYFIKGYGSGKIIAILQYTKTTD